MSIGTFGNVCPVRPIALGEGVRIHRYDVRDTILDSFKASSGKPKSLLEEMFHKHTSRTDLSDRYIKVLRYMSDHPDAETPAEARGAGENALRSHSRGDH